MQNLISTLVRLVKAAFPSGFLDDGISCQLCGEGLFIPTYHVRKSLLDGGNPSLALDLIADLSARQLFCYT